MPPSDQNRDLTLPPDTYLYLQNESGNGQIAIHRGPTTVNQTGQDKPVRYDPQTRKYIACGLDQSVQQFPRAGEGEYIVLENPAEDDSFPKEARTTLKNLYKGRKIVINGPWSEALYPGQVATVVEGHRLRSNQYLVAIVYNADEAKKNWSHSVVKTAESQTEEPQKGLRTPKEFGVGTRIVICGGEVSFFIPCTGVEVLRDEDGKYVREAVTLEQLEYCCLVDESGKKEYPRGPAVIFPSPTQVFEKDNRGRRKFRPTELNTINGLHLKVTADFEDEDITVASNEKGERPKRQYREGEELFVTGKTLSIYYPREELSPIEYGAGNKKHYSTGIPEGEGRYVMDRESGGIRIERGPKMFLADPRFDIPVRRVLGPDECKLWYPGNAEALAYNQDLAEAMAESPSGRSGGVISEGDYRKRQMKRGLVSGLESQAAYLAAGVPMADEYQPEEVSEIQADTTITRGYSNVQGSKQTQQRTITLNTKYDGTPRCEVWPGYAVLVVGSTGRRRVVCGPEVILLEYSEKLGFMELSTGKPKSTDKLIRTAYLGIQNNQVSDIVGFESADHVKAKVKISLRVNFEAETEDDRLKWFSTDNYVKYLCDHVRSIIAGMAKRNTIAQIKSDYINLVRDAILGAKGENGKRASQTFDNGMRITEAEVLDMTLDDATIAKLLNDAQQQVVKSNIEIDQAKKDLEATETTERIKRQKSEVISQTAQKQQQLKVEETKSTLNLALAQIDAELQKKLEESKRLEADEAAHDLSSSRQRDRDKADADQMYAISERDQKLKESLILAETNAAVKKLEAVKEGLGEMIATLSRDDMASKLAIGLNLERHLTGEGLESSLVNIMSMFPTIQQFMERGKGIQQNRLTGAATK